MAKERKSPQEKKQDHYKKDHFTSGWNSQKSFRKGWKRKKAHVNREYRRKSDEVLAPAKTGIAAEDIELIGDDLTANRFENSVLRKRLRKVGTVTVGDKIRIQLEKRQLRTDRRLRQDQRYDQAATFAVNTLCSLEGEELIGAARSFDLLCANRNPAEWKRVFRSKAPVDRAMLFLYALAAGSVWECDALKRNPELNKALGAWVEKAVIIARREERSESKRKLRKPSSK